MAEIRVQDELTEKLTILSDAAKYDVACTSSGVGRKGDGTHMGSTSDCGICHTFTPDGRCISLLKILFTNECIYNCKYCVNRSSNDVKRVSFTPDEVCRLTIEFYRRNYIEGLFLSSGIIQSPDVTMGLLYETLFLLRTKYHFNGYIHIKGIPGASAEIVEMVGYLCDRMSVNLELPTAEGLRSVAPNKVRRNILTPMRQIQNGIKESRLYHGVTSMKSRVYVDEQSYYDQLAEISYSKDKLMDKQKKLADKNLSPAGQLAEKSWNFADVKKQDRTVGLQRPDRYFVPAGQSTQMIIGATGESDYEIMSVTEALYHKFEMKRVFYSAFINVNQDESLPGLLLSEQNPNFHELIDPKCYWAVKHLELFPVEVNQADYYTLLRVPGIGTTSARRIMTARKHAKLDFSDIKKMGVVLKRALYFITCKGKMMYETKMEEHYITNHLIYNEKPNQMLLSDGKTQSYEQLSLFDYGMQQVGGRCG